MTELCHKRGCIKLGTKSCGVCRVACYCNVVCQKEDWKVHKEICFGYKKLPLIFLSLQDVRKYALKAEDLIDILRPQNKLKVIIKLRTGVLEFLEHQYGKQVVGTRYFMRIDGDLVDSMLLIRMRREILIYCANTGRLADVEFGITLAIKAREMLEHRIEFDETSITLISEIEREMSNCYALLKQYSVAEEHFEQSMKFAKRIKGEERVQKEYEALKMFGVILLAVARHDDYLACAEMAYVLVSEAYELTHPTVQDASMVLISFLMSYGKMNKAEDYARINYESLVDPYNGIDPSSLIVARGMRLVAAIWVRKPPGEDEEIAAALAEEAEVLIRKACIILEKGREFRHFTDNERDFHNFTSTLSDVLLKRRKFTEECRLILERSLAQIREEIETTDPYILCKHLEQLVFFHVNRSELMPPSDERLQEANRGQVYDKEAFELRQVNNFQDDDTF